MATTETIVSFLLGFASGAGATVVADWFNDYRKRLKMRVDVAIQTVTKTTAKNSMAMGFGISIEQGKELKDAYVRCNGQRYSWYENGSPKEKTQLFVGEEPNWFFPYFLTLDYVDDLSTQSNVVTIIKREKQSNHGVLLTVRELNTSNIIFSRCYA